MSLDRDTTTTANFAQAAKQQLQFPRENVSDFKAYIRFQPIITTPPSLGENSRIGALVLRTVDNVLNGNASAAGQDDAVFDGVINAYNNGSDNHLERSKRNPSKQRCVLYMPSSFNMQDGVSYSTPALGILGQSMKEGIEGGSGIIDGGLSAATDGLKNLIAGVTGGMGQDAARLAAARLTQSLTQNSFADGAVRSALKTSAHPNIALLFDKPELRTFRFQFKMQPTTEEEAIEIEKIVKFFRTELYPESFGISGSQAYSSGPGATQEVSEYEVKAGYKFPNEIQISLHYDLDRNTRSDVSNAEVYSESKWFRFKPCYLRSVNATYNTSNTNSFYKGGYFQETTLDLSFQENELMDKNAVAKGF
tara:strand:+ start:21257 stop:22348 length:1092 start_codon:yes stop_codon:yes gene_type:complete